MKTAPKDNNSMFIHKLKTYPLSIGIPFVQILLVLLTIICIFLFPPFSSTPDIPGTMFNLPEYFFIIIVLLTPYSFFVNILKINELFRLIALRSGTSESTFLPYIVAYLLVELLLYGIDHYCNTIQDKSLFETFKNVRYAITIVIGTIFVLILAYLIFASYTR